ncbi:MAG: hypothetical protein SGI96_03190 [Bacteroidota bacterium]|nr:hypothetical protein [Bacteroidota bacterium]
MIVITETSGIQEVEQLLQMLKSTNIQAVKVEASPSAPHLAVSKGDKKLDPKELFGIWKDNPRTIEQVRSTAWKRNWTI